jgi:hypothetical protein
MIPDKKIRAVLIVLLFALLLVGGTVGADPSAVFTSSRSVIGGGGGQGENGGYWLGGTIGQNVLGVGETATHYLCAGFWCRLAAYEIYLPLILRGT